MAKPKFWWRAPALQMRQWVPGDPNALRGGFRWHDRRQQRWPPIAAAVVSVSESLAAGEWHADEDLGPGERGAVNVELGSLTLTEKAIVQSWFSLSEEVCVDPWFEPLVNGRHRLWATLDYFGESLVPIAGDALGYANPESVAALGKTWAGSFVKHVEELRSVEWFQRSDPVNQRFVASLETAADGQIPSAV